MKLCLGTVQFGMDYGIRGGNKPPLRDAIAMLDYATHNGVDAIDTAVAYGDSESVVGEFLKHRSVPRDRLFIVSKFGLSRSPSGRCTLRDATYIGKQLDESLQRLHTDYVDAYVCHDASAVGDPVVIESMLKMKSSGKVRHIGFSVYEPEDAVESSKVNGIDFVQLPFSIFDQRMASEGVLPRLSDGGVDIHSRSAFVQGLVLMSEDEVPSCLARVKPYVALFQKSCRDFGVSPRTVAMAFVKKRHEISHLVFGVDNMAQLAENISSFNADVPAATIDEIARILVGIPPELVMPNTWRAR